MIKAITFDLDGVYFPHGKKNFLTALADRGVPAADAKRVFLDSREMHQEYKLGKMTDAEFWGWAAQEWKTKLTAPQLIELLVASYDVDENVKATVKSARTHGYKTLICSNNFPARIDGLQHRFGFLDDFDVAVLSYEVGAIKPDPAIFQALVDQSDIPAAEIIFADDDEKALAGAKEAGITAFLYTGFDGFIAKLKEYGVEL